MVQRKNVKKQLRVLALVLEYVLEYPANNDVRLEDAGCVLNLVDGRVVMNEFFESAPLGRGPRILRQ
jgi:hypothetical protein